MDALTRILSELIAADTRNPGGDEPALAARIHDHLARHQPDVLETVHVPNPDGERTGAYVYAHWGQPTRMVNVHLDTVPDNRGWSRDPHQPLVTAERVVGLGAADIKGALACCLRALLDVKPRNLALLFSGDEERASTCMAHFLERGMPDSMERVVVCEPTGCRVGVRHRGLLCFSVEVARQGGHSSQADRLPAAIVELSRLAVALHAFGQARADQGPEGYPGMCMNVASIDGGVAFNVVPERAALTFSVRPPPGLALDPLEAELRGLVGRSVADAKVQCTLARPGFQTSAPEDFVPLLGEEAARPVDLPYWTEAALLVAQGVDAVVYGPGDVAQAHAADEWVAIDELARAQRALTSLIGGG